MTIESTLRAALAKDPRAFGKALSAMGFASDRKPPRLRDELRRKFKTPEALLRQLGMDSAMFMGPPEQRSESILDNKGAREMAAHGKALDDFEADDNGGDWRERVASYCKTAACRRTTSIR